MNKIAIAALFVSFVAQTGCQANGTDSAGGNLWTSCSTIADCPQSDNPCVKTRCESGICGTAFVVMGTVISDAETGDCQVPTCDGDGNIVAKNDDMDLPDDGNICTNDLCTSGIPSNLPAAVGTSCSKGSGTQCNGAGACVECVTIADCPGQDNDCESRTCVSGICGVVFAPVGTPSSAQTAGDCNEIICDGSGSTTMTPDDTDLPMDGNACTVDTCMGGVAMNPFLPVDSSCNQNGGKVCSSSGACVQCNSGNQCASEVCVGGVCQAASCIDGVQNGDESYIDCGGGVCPACDVGTACQNAMDCSSGVCTNAVCAPPVVLGTMPADGQSAVSVTTPISIVFSGAMNPPTLTAQSMVGPCTGSVQLSTDGFVTCLGFSSVSPMMSAGNSVAAWTPAPALSYGSTYFIRVTTAAHGADGTPIDAMYSSSAGFVTDTPTSSCDGSLVISQIYGGGGNSGATYKNDFVEIHNRGKTPVDLSGWSVQYASAAGSSWLVTNLNGMIAAGGYYLVQGATGTIGAPLPTPDVIGGTNMSASAGKVALVHATTALSGSCPVGLPIIDFVGYGTTANCFDGPAAASAVSSAAQSMQRAGAGCVDTNANNPDFTAAPVLPRNTMSGSAICTCPVQGSVNETDFPAEIDFCNVQSPTSITVAALNATPMILGLITEAGFTDAPGANASVIVEVGFGLASVNPTTQSGWQFFPTVYGMQVGNADEYRGSLTPTVPGSYRYAYRASVDGVQWTYCDLDGSGSNVGVTFEISQLPILTVTP